MTTPLGGVGQLTYEWPKQTGSQGSMERAVISFHYWQQVDLFKNYCKYMKYKKNLLLKYMYYFWFNVIFYLILILNGEIFVCCKSCVGIRSFAVVLFNWTCEIFHSLFLWPCITKPKDIHIILPFMLCLFIEKRLKKAWMLESLE